MYVLQPGEYTFNASTGIITFVQKQDLLNNESLKKITNARTHQLIYDVEDKGLLAEISGATIDLVFNTDKMFNSDPLKIEVFDPSTAAGTETEFVIDPFIQVGVGGQTVFSTVRDAIGNIDMTEGGINNVITPPTQTGVNEMTAGSLLGQGTIVQLKYLAIKL